MATTVAVAAGVAATPRLRETVSFAGVAAAGFLGLGLALCIAGPMLAVSAAGRHRGQVVGATIVFGAVGFAINFIAQAWLAVFVVGVAAAGWLLARRDLAP